MDLSLRLEKIASFVEAGSVVADIGTDHGYLPICLVQRGISPKAYAFDLRRGPLERARDHIAQAGLQDRVMLRLSDGLSGLKPDEADTVVIAGMGGALIDRILERSQETAQAARTLILSPQSEPWKVRERLDAMGFYIDLEHYLEEDGKYYVVMRAVHGAVCTGTPTEYKYGRYALEHRDPVLLSLLLKEQEKYRGLLMQLLKTDSLSARERQVAVEKELADIKDALDYWRELE